MFELVYHSMAKPKISQDDIGSILKRARVYNSANNITGCLLYHDNEFLQILEGEKESIKDLYSSIVKDKRHSNVHLIIENEKRKRIFPDWSMAYYNIKDNDLLKFDSLSEFINNSSLAVDLFCEMYQQILSVDRKF